MTSDSGRSETTTPTERIKEIEKSAYNLVGTDPIVKQLISDFNFILRAYQTAREIGIDSFSTIFKKDYLTTKKEFDDEFNRRMLSQEEERL